MVRGGCTGSSAFREALKLPYNYLKYQIHFQLKNSRDSEFKLFGFGSS